MRVGLACLLVLGCGGSRPLGSDAGVPDLGGGVDAAVDLSPPTVTGTRLKPGGTQLVGLTTDGQIVLLDDTDAVSAVPLAGGAAQIVSPAPATNNQAAETLGRLVVVFPSADFTTGRSGLAIWTPASGLKTISTSSMLFNSPSASSDGAWLLYFDNVTSDGGTGDLTVAKADGTMKRVLAAAVSTSAAGTLCSAQLAWAGTLAVYATCPAGPADGGTVPVTIGTFDPATNATQTLTANGSFFQVSPNGKNVLVSDFNNNLSVVTPPSATLVPVDTNAGQAFFAPDGSLIYSGSSLMHATLAPLVKVALQSPPGGNPAFAAGNVSPDSKWFGLSTMFDPNGNGSDYWLGSTNPALPPTSVQPQTTVAFGGNLGAGDSFTRDSKQALFLDAFDGTNFVGTLKSIPTAGGVAITWGTPPTSWVAAAPGGKIVFNDHWIKSSNAAQADLRVGDTANAGAAPTLLAERADPTFLITPDGQSVLYTTHAAGAEGLWIAPLP
jgi:hypothetical protein